MTTTKDKNRAPNHHNFDPVQRLILRYIRYEHLVWGALSVQISIKKTAQQNSWEQNGTKTNSEPSLTKELSKANPQIVPKSTIIVFRITHLSFLLLPWRRRTSPRFQNGPPRFKNRGDETAKWQTWAPRVTAATSVMTLFGRETCKQTSKCQRLITHFSRETKRRKQLSSKNTTSQQAIESINHPANQQPRSLQLSMGLAAGAKPCGNFYLALSTKRPIPKPRPKGEVTVRWIIPCTTEFRNFRKIIQS